MEFCPVCRRLLFVKEEDGKKIGYCICGFKRMSGISIESKDFTIENNKKELRDGNTFSNDSESYNNICKKCGFDKADVIDFGESNDESSVYLIKCRNCGYTERQSSGI